MNIVHLSEKYELNDPRTYEGIEVNWYTSNGKR